MLPPARKGLLRNQRHFLLGFSFIYEVSRRHPFLYAPTILSVAIRYDEMMKNCCGGAEDPTQDLEECFRSQVFHRGVGVYYCATGDLPIAKQIPKQRFRPFRFPAPEPASRFHLVKSG